MHDIIIIRNGEISIKGKNRFEFENALVRQLRAKLKDTPAKVQRRHGRFEIILSGAAEKEVLDKISDSFGIVSLSPGMTSEPGYDNLINLVRKYAEQNIDTARPLSFKSEIKRHDKSFALTSPQINAQIGDILTGEFKNLSVDVKTPDFVLYGEVREDINIVYSQKIKGRGGMPKGINGKATVLLSGGIDSPVAAYLMSRKGLKIETVHFHSYPFTSLRSQEKVKDILRILRRYTDKLRLNMVNILEIQNAVKEKCPPEHLTIITRRFMMRLAQEIALRNKSDMLVTGESVGQVASQTAQGLRCTDEVVSAMPVMRPLIAMEKSLIIKKAEEIGTYETSIIPEVDSCTVFLPDKTATKPEPAKIRHYEEKLDVDGLVKVALETVQAEIF